MGRNDGLKTPRRYFSASPVTCQVLSSSSRNVAICCVTPNNWLPLMASVLVASTAPCARRSDRPWVGDRQEVPEAVV
jgi:hypothetical protein